MNKDQNRESGKGKQEEKKIDNVLKRPESFEKKDKQNVEHSRDQPALLKRLGSKHGDRVNRKPTYAELRAGHRLADTRKKGDSLSVIESSNLESESFPNEGQAKSSRRNDTHIVMQPQETSDGHQKKTLTSDTHSKQDELAFAEKQERNRIGQPRDIGQDYIGFPFGSTEIPPGEFDNMIKGSGLPADLAAVDPATEIHITAYASRPGKEGDNMKLSESRALAVKREFQLRGFQGKITIDADGEAMARALSHSPEDDKGSYDQKDDSRFRIATIEIKEPVAEFEPQIIRTENLLLKERWTIFLVDKDVGETIFNKVFNPLGEDVRHLVSLISNPVFDDPSADPEEFAGQLQDITEKTLKQWKNPPRALLDWVGGSFFEIFVRNPQKHKVALKRRPYYEAISEGLADGLNESDPDERHYRPSTEVEEHFYNEARNRTQNLSAKEKYQLGVYLTEVYRLSLKTQFDSSSQSDDIFEFHRKYNGPNAWYLATKNKIRLNKHYHRE